MLDMLLCPQMWWGAFCHCLSAAVYKSVSVKVTLFVHVTIDLLFGTTYWNLCPLKAIRSKYLCMMIILAQKSVKTQLDVFLLTRI